MDDPLPHPTQLKILANFHTMRHWDLEPRFKSCDSLLGRVRREFEKKQPTMFPIGRVRSLADASRSADMKKHRISENVVLDAWRSSV